LHVKIQEERVK